MFKLKAGNVFQKINKMDRKQAYTLGAIVVVIFIALLTLASFMGEADDTSFDGMSTRGYDLAQMPFVNDEAESYLLASKYPDMQNNGASLLYSQEEKEARQEEDAEKEAASGGDGSEDEAGGSASYSGRGYGGRGYGAGGGGGAGGATKIGQLGSATIGHAGGSGINATFGAPRGDFSPYKSQDKGTEIPAQLRNTDARKALSQFAQMSRAAAGLKDGKGGNAKKALMGGNIKGSDAFTDKGVDLSKSGGLALDTDAPLATPDLSNLEDDIGDQADKDKEDDDQEQEDMWDRLREQLLSGLINMGLNLAGNALGNVLDNAFAGSKTKAASKEVMQQQLGATYDAKNPNSPSNTRAQLQLCGDTTNCMAYDMWKTSALDGNPITVSSAATASGLSDKGMRLNVKHNASQFSYGNGTLADVYSKNTTQIGSSSPQKQCDKSSCTSRCNSAPDKNACISTCMGSC